MGITHFAVLFIALIQLACGYQVYRNVKDYGAKGDGLADDSDAIINALSQDRNFDPSTQTPAFVFFPPGTYKVTKTLPMAVLTQVVGDELNTPVIKMVCPTPIRVLDSQGAWYHDAAQNNFFHQVRNLVIDMLDCPQCTGLHWQVAQATSLHNLYFKMAKGSQAQGIWMEDGSGGWMSDLVFEGGIYGLWIGNQQFTSRNLTIRDASVAAIYLNWDWVWTFQGLSITNSPIGIDLGNQLGSLVLIDSVFKNCSTGVRTGYKPDSKISSNSVLFDNVKFESTPLAVVNDGETVLLGRDANGIKSWGQGFIWQNKQSTKTIMNLTAFAPNRPASLAPNGNFFQQGRPYLTNQIDVTTLGLRGDNAFDNTHLLQQAVNKFAGKATLFFPYGIYLLKDTVYLPTGTKMLGQVWSILMAAGTNFSDAANPRPMLRVGNEGEKGLAQLIDFLITTRGPQPGCVLIEWNLKELFPGSCGMWDVHFRVGGAIGTLINPADCPADDGTNSPASHCSGVWALLHITRTGSAYLENVWGWVADHDIDRKNQINVYSARGFLCESQGPVWLYGTAFEHSLYYQYNFYGAQEILMTTIQTETPYFQPSAKTPFTPDAPTDPQFCSASMDDRCQMSYSLSIQNSKDIFLYGSGQYSFFNTWNQDCLKANGGPQCQLNLNYIANSQPVYLHSMNTYGSIYMYTSNVTYSKANLNENNFCSSCLVDLNLFGSK